MIVKLCGKVTLRGKRWVCGFRSRLSTKSIRGQWVELGLRFDQGRHVSKVGCCVEYEQLYIVGKSLKAIALVVSSKSYEQLVDTFLVRWIEFASLATSFSLANSSAISLVAVCTRTNDTDAILAMRCILELDPWHDFPEQMLAKK